MKKAILTILMMLLFGVCSVQAVDITFSTSGTIVNGNVYDDVYVENDGTIVDMFGGQIEGLWLYDTSIFNLHNGQIVGYFSGIDIGHLSTINVLGGVIDKSSDFVVHGNANFDGGSITAGRLKTYEDSIVTLTGGFLNLGMLEIHGELNIYGGMLDIEDNGGTDGVVNIYGYDFTYIPTGDPFWGGGTLTGYLLDNNPFIIKGLSQNEFENFNLIPEPMTVLLLGLGGVFLRRKS